MSTSETANLLSALLEVTPKEQEQIATLLSQNGTITFWECLESWGLSAELLEKLQAVKQVLQATEEGRDT
ncbi:hypothetical protein NST83_20440 [Paenibacillus sp. FSL R10-2782]|uniref:hypothetical protein n=1 Tax=Paenibacillus sp. FSL R10-2782 TaxID=2954661 RepID=UPI003158A2B6